MGAPTLIQVWFRWADYIVPRDDVDVFTLGSLPRNPAFARALDELSGAILDVLGGEERRSREVADAIHRIPNPWLIRVANVTGRFHIRWDTRMVTLRAAPEPLTDPESARLELARRFLGWLGPSNARRFARWAGVTRRDAEETWSALAHELAPVAVEGLVRTIRAADLPALVYAEPVTGVRFLPQGDPFLSADPLVAQREPAIERPGVQRRVLNSLSGRILVDGALVGSWGRRQHQLTLAPWDRLPRSTLDAIADEGESLWGPIGRPMRLRRLD